jgi:hypothetical protein
LFLAGALASHAPSASGADNGEAKGESGVMWTGGMGVSYPLVASISGGAIVPLAKKEEGAPYGFPGVPAVHANVDIGLGGGMLSGGLSFPLEAGYGTSAISFKAAAIRTWLIDLGPDRNRTYGGGLIELLVSSHPSAKLGLGYFRDTESTPEGRDDFVFLYLGVGL